MAERGVCCCFWLAWVAQLRATDIVLGLLRLSKHSNCMAGLPVQYDCGQTGNNNASSFVFGAAASGGLRRDRAVEGSSGQGNAGTYAFRRIKQQDIAPVASSLFCAC